MKNNLTVELEDSVRMYEYLKSKFDGVNKIPVLVDTGSYTEISKEAREFSYKPETNQFTLATAVIVQSLAHRIIINFFISVTKQRNGKMYMFEDKDKAVEWLLNQKQ